MEYLTADDILKNRNRNLGAMFAAEFAADYLRILFVLLQFRRNHELEVLRDVLFQAALEISPVSCNGEVFDSARFDLELNQLDNWGIIGKRLEKTRLRSYKDIRRDRFQFSLPDETVAFLIWLEERRENDLLPKDDDSINLLEFILSSLKQISRSLKMPEEHFSAVVFSLGDVQEKTARLSRNLSGITVRLGEFLLRNYSPEEAREIVAGLDVYFKHYLEQLFKLRSAILRELETLGNPEAARLLDLCFERFASEQRKLPRLMRVGTLSDSPQTQMEQLFGYFRRGGRVDHLCGGVHDNAMKVLGKLTSYLKELERRSNRLEFIQLRLEELAGKNAGFESPVFLRELLNSAAAPLDMNDSDEFQKAEPPPPRSGNSARRIPPRLFSRTRPLAEKHVETMEEMRLRELDEFLHERYPQNGPLADARLELGEFLQIANLLKAGLLGNGRVLRKIGRQLEIDPATIPSITGRGGILTGPAIVLTEAKKYE
ncbi:DUF2397 family protein [Victivallis vadensis]|uniref:DUF2397 family protein n=1 Tax=Victivallis vadensis TaxID=172901 RepID=UPI00307FA803